MPHEAGRVRKPRLIGYARISRPEQRLESQVAALVRAGVRPSDIYRDRASGARTDRPGLAQALATARQGDTLVIWKLDRLGRKLLHILEMARDLEARGIRLMCITQNIDTSTATGKLVFHLLAMVAEMERDLIRERTLVGIAHARKEGRVGGRKPMDPKLFAKRRAQVMRLQKRGLTMVQIAQELGAARSTVYLWRYGQTPSIMKAQP